jgi:hypothetical protein
MGARLGVIVVAFLAVAAGANASVFVVNDAKRRNSRSTPRAMRR